MNRLLTLAILLLLTTACKAADIVVHPGESLHEALRQAREWRRTGDNRCQGGITIVIKAGRYYMDEPLFLRPEDSGTPDSPTVICGEAGTVICGDATQQHRQLWPAEGMAPIIDFNTAQRTITIGAPDENVLNGTDPMEMVVHQRWAIAILRVKEICRRGGSAIVSFHEPESRLEFEHPWPQPVIGGERGSSSFLLRSTEQRDGVEQLVVVDGAHHIIFRGITFESTCWNRPLHRGHVTLQGGFPIVDAYKLKENEGLPWDATLENQAWVERPVSAVTVREAESVDFIGCTFRHLGATALDYVSVKDATVDSCRFEDIGGTAILAGSFAESPREVHRPYNDLAERCQHLTITHNTIHDAANEDWGAVGIGCGYVRDVVISDNSVSHVNYSGICVGWGWTAAYTGMEHNIISRNHVSDYARQLYDAGGIYTLSNQPRSIISDNVISAPAKAPYATNDRAFAIYLDARTDGFTLSGNTIEGRPLRRDEIGDNQPGPNLIFQ